MITPEKIEQLAKELNLSVWTYSRNISLQSSKKYGLRPYNKPEFFDFRLHDDGTYDLYSYLSGIDENEDSLVYTVIFGVRDNCYEYCKRKFEEFEIEHKNIEKMKLKNIQEDFK